MARGKLIVLEGIDGTGKSTQAKLLAQHLQQLGQNTLLSFEPTNSPFGQQIRNSFTTKRLPREQELQLFLNDRRHHVQHTILPALQAGTTVILDRYYFSNIAYQSAEGLNPQHILQQNLTFAPQPDWLLIFDLPTTTALQRIQQRNTTPNTFEKQTTLQACRQTFLQFTSLPYAQLIDASLPPQHIHNQITQLYQQKFPT